ncbi:DUF1015 domain-containing protein [Streptomyces sp. PTM05]|uniref:DUF1015 domain-containing protein n=1 Tax=Streptantibioticus parmotrematis TaxID=2873249 RepID=A0ABS7QS66_9ACTN|nr:DUF1015 domain-containing protein [Streptantibioticus parmotrematis]MBY8884654.1 DUF1015 domain-containing protein [Streptantibioticus parmotrematis]
MSNPGSSPGLHRGEPRRVPGLRLAPFRGLRYVPERVGSLSAVTSPPYDVVVRPDGLDHLETLDPYNIVRLTLPRDGDTATRHAQAARTLRHWLRDDVLAADPEPALYVYEQRPRDGGVQRGLIGALRLTGPEERVVLPHEHVMPEPVADRAGLMRATAANLEPLLLAYRGDEAGAAALLVERTAELPPLLATTTEDGTRHRLWAVTDPDAIGAVDADLTPRQALIADGHHRWATYLRLLDERPAHDPGGWDHGLVLLVDTTRYPLRVRAIHRVLRELPVADALAAVRDAFDVREVPGPLENALEALAAATSGRAGGGGNAFLLAGDGHFHLLTGPDERLVAEAVPQDQPRAWRELDATVLHSLLIDRVWRVPDDPEHIGYVHDAPAAVRQAERLGGTAVLMHPVAEHTVLELAREGVMMPRKSTSFGPKPASGLVLRRVESED